MLKESKKSQDKLIKQVAMLSKEIKELKQKGLGKAAGPNLVRFEHPTRSWYVYKQMAEEKGGRLPYA